MLARKITLLFLCITIFLSIYDCSHFSSNTTESNSHYKVNPSYIEVMTKELVTIRIPLSANSLFEYIYDPGIVRKLLESGINPDSTNAIGETPLFRAAERGHLESIKVLLEFKAKIDKVDNRYRTPLMAASENGKSQSVEVLLKSGVDVNKTTNTEWSPLMSAVSSGSYDTISQLIENGANVNAKSFDGYTPLIIAVEKENLKVVDLLIRNRANSNMSLNDGRSALILASEKSNDEILTTLLSHGADVNAKTSSQLTPLMMATIRGRGKNVEILIDHGADVNAEQYGGPTALTFAKAGGYTEISNSLLKAGAKPIGRTSVFSKYKGDAAGETRLEGNITFKGIPPPPKLFDLEKFPHSKFCGQVDNDGKGHRVLRDVVVSKGRLQDVVVYIPKITAGKPFQFFGTDVIVDKCRFLVQARPSTFVGVVVKGTEFRIVNNDADPTDPKAATGVLRNPHLYEELGQQSSTIFNLPLPNKGSKVIKPVILRKEGSILHLQSDQGNYMNAFFFPVENPYYAIVGADGVFSIDQVPTGRYKIVAWHPILGVQEKEIEVGTSGKVTVNFEFSGCQFMC
jgi:ankyrin repeat protein